MTSYTPAGDRYESVPIAVAGAAACSCPPYRSGCGRTSATTGPSTPSAPSAASLRLGHHPFRPGQQLRAAYGSAETNFARILHTTSATTATNW